MLARILTPLKVILNFVRDIFDICRIYLVCLHVGFMQAPDPFLVNIIMWNTIKYFVLLRPVLGNVTCKCEQHKISGFLRHIQYLPEHLSCRSFVQIFILLPDMEYNHMNYGILWSDLRHMAACTGQWHFTSSIFYPSWFPIISTWLFVPWVHDRSAPFVAPAYITYYILNVLQV